MRLTHFLFLLFSFFSTTISAQDTTFDPEQRLPDGVTKPIPKRIAAVATTEAFTPRVDPQSWWIGFKNPTVELMIHDRDIHDHTVIIKHKGLKINKIDRVENRNYLFITLEIATTAMAGDVDIVLQKGTDSRTHKWRLDKRNTEGSRNQGITTKDFMYLIMPDRFANGDPANDVVSTMNQKGVDRRKMFFRHGGDLRGIINHLDYLQELGATALWLNPVQENDEPFESYHGYAITDLYNIDRRFGTNATYKELADKCHGRGLKVVMDVVPNHVGNESYFIKDLPEATWVHQFDTFTRTTYRDQPVFDPYASDFDKKRTQTGWFDVTMPDMNPEGNAHAANFITQSHLWWLEFAGVDGLRIDTYLYNDPVYMSEWGKRINLEFPKVHTFGETWVHGMVNQAYSTAKVGLKKKFNSYLSGVTDFQLYFSIQEALNKPQGWTEGVTQLYQDLSSDYIYDNPYQNVVFLDNHDLGRFYSIVNENTAKYKGAIAWLMTVRGIPQWYYGAELGMTGFTNPDGKVRQDMPGGWKEDPKSVFTEGGRNAKENDIFNYTKKMASWRKTKTCLHDGKMTQFLPVDGIYVYFRYDANGTVMVLMNTNDKPVSVDTKRFEERTKGFLKGKNVATDALLSDMKRIELDKNETKVIELIK